LICPCFCAISRICWIISLKPDALFALRNLLSQAKNAGLDPDQAAHAARSAREREADNLERVLSLFPKLRQRPKQLVRTMSGGERQMVAIGRAMMSAPTILLLDEPSLGLAPLLCTELFRTLARIKEAGVGIFLVEQNAKQSLAIADRGYLLDNGHIVETGSHDDLITRGGPYQRFHHLQKVGT